MPPAKQQWNVKIDADLHTSLRAILDEPGAPKAQAITDEALREWLKKRVAAQKGVSGAGAEVSTGTAGLVAIIEQLNILVRNLSLQLAESDRNIKELGVKMSDLTDVNAAYLRAAHVGISVRKEG